MSLMATTLSQTDPELLHALGRIATAQTVMMVIALLFVVLAIAAGLLSYNTMKTLDRTLNALEKVVDELAPRAEPLIDGATRVAVDAAAITDSVRLKVNDFLDTVEDVNGRLRTVVDAAEQRVREFGTVLDVVQDETQKVMLDAASTARGVHEAAQALQRPRRPPRRLPRPAEESADEE